MRATRRDWRYPVYSSVVLAIKFAVTLLALSLVAATALAGAETTPPAPAIAPDFRIVGDRPLPGRCAPSLVAPRMAAVLGAFNAGRTVAFVSRFAVNASFNPYNGRPGGSYNARGRAAIASVVRTRHRAGDGWTAYLLFVPVGTTRDEGREGIFGLFLRVRVDGVTFEQGVKVIVSCSTGKVLTWLGPAWKSQT